MTTIYYVRHGQTDDNVNNILTGRVDVPLNDKGIAQAQITADKLANIKFDAAFRSPLLRAKQTADVINKNKRLQFIVDERLIERDYGDYTNKTVSDIDREVSWNYNLSDKAYPGVESPKQIYKRVKSFIEHIKQDYTNKTILIVAHSGVGRLFQVYFEGLPKDGNLLKLSLKNAEVAKYEF